MTTPPRTAVRRLALARLISLTGSHAAFIALMYTVYQRTGSSAWLAAALFLTIGTGGFVAPLAGVIGDRFDRQRVMVISDLAGAFMWAGLILARDPALLLVLAFLAAVAEAPFLAASEAAIPNLVEAEDLAWANGTISVGRNLGLLVGPAVGGALVAAIGPGGVFAANAVSFAVSAALVTTVKARFVAERNQEDQEEHRGVRAGFRFIRRDRTLSTIVVAAIVFLFAAGLSFVADIPLAKSFGTGSLGYGLIFTSWGAGGILGSLAGRRLVNAGNELRVLVVAALATAAGFFAVGFTPWFGLVLAGMLLGGSAHAIGGVAELGIFQRRTPDVVRSRVLAAFDAVAEISLGLAILAGGLVVGVIGPKPTYTVGGVGGVLAAFLLLPLAGRPLVRFRRRTYTGSESQGSSVAPG
jgi:MFS family permease